MCSADANDLQKRVTATEALIAQARSAGNLWRDTKKLLLNAKNLIAAGEQEQAAKILNEAGQQAQLAYQQATAQSTIANIVPYYLK